MEGIRDLTHAQIKELRKAGLDSATAGKPQTEEEAAIRGAQLIDWIIENVYGDLAEAGTPFKGNMDYLAIIPRALSTAEIATYYNALMKMVERSIVTDLLPANSIALGYLRTDSTRVIELDDFSYKYGRNEGIGKSEGNKRVVLPWKYFSGVNTFYYDNPLGTTNIRMTPLFATDLSVGTKIFQPYGYENDYNNYNNNMLVSAEPSGKIKLVTGTSQQGTGLAAGYASALLEVI